MDMFASDDDGSDGGEVANEEDMFSSVFPSASGPTQRALFSADGEDMFYSVFPSATGPTQRALFSADDEDMFSSVFPSATGPTQRSLFSSGHRWRWPKKTKGRKLPTCLIKVGPWGGHGGTPRDISSSSKPQRLESITVRSTDNYGGRINGFSFVYVDQNGQSIPVGTWGSTTKGSEDTITMGEGEYVNQMEGTVDDTGVTSLKFVTSTGVEYGTYGNQSGKAFSIALALQQRNASALICFFGRSRDSLLALGTYVAPIVTA